MATTTKYTHLELGKDIQCIAGYYTPLREERLKYNDKEVLYVVGSAVIDSSCCGAGNWGYITVPGYILNWQSGKNQAGLWESEVETISDKEAQDNIRNILLTAEPVSHIAFW